MKYTFIFLILLLLSCKKNCGQICHKNNPDKTSTGRHCYTSGTFDMFHVGHLNLLKNAKGLCDTLIVGVHPDDVVFENKNKYPVIPLQERMAVIEAIKFVDAVVSEPEYNYTKGQVDKFKVNTLIIGDDYLGKYDNIEKEMANYGVKLIFLPYTKSQSSSKIRESLKKSK